MPQQEVQVACAWCGLYSDPGPVCEVCGSPLPDLTSPSTSLRSGSLLTPQELEQLIAQPPVQTRAEVIDQITEGTRIAGPPEAGRAGSWESAARAAAEEARETTSLAPERTSGRRARMRRHPSFDPTVTPQRTAEEEILIESWKASFVVEQPEALPPAAEEDAPSPQGETGESIGVEDPTDSMKPPASYEGGSVADGEDTSPKKYMLWPWSRKHLIAPQDATSGPTLEPEEPAAVEPTDFLAEEAASSEMTAEPEPHSPEQPVSEPPAEAPLEQVDLPPADLPAPISAVIDQSPADPTASLDPGPALLVADPPIDAPMIDLPVEPRASSEEASPTDEQRPARRRWLRRGARREAPPELVPPAPVEDAPSAVVEPMAVAPTVEAVSFPEPPPPVEETPLVVEPVAVEVPAPVEDAPSAVVEPPPVQEVPAVEAVAVVEPPPVEEVPAVEAVAVVEPPPVEEVPAVEAVAVVEPPPVEEVPAVEAVAVVEPPPVEEVPAVEAVAVVEPPPVEETPPPVIEPVAVEVPSPVAKPARPRSVPPVPARVVEARPAAPVTPVAPDVAAASGGAPDSVQDAGISTIRAGAWKLMPAWPKRRVAAPSADGSEAPSPSPVAGPSVVPGQDEQAPAGKNPRRATREPPAPERPAAKVEASPPTVRRKPAAPRPPAPQVASPPKVDPGRARPSGQAPPAPRKTSRAPTADKAPAGGALVVVMPSKVPCSKCGGPSERGLCEACLEAIRELRELSLGFSDVD
jgi:hypothetical protein